jgi:short chain dehydrogenase
MSPTLFDLSGRARPCDRWQQGARQGHGPDAGQAGASVAIPSRHEDELKFVAAEIGRETHAKVVPLAADLAHRGEVKGPAEQAIAAHGKVGIVIDIAGGDMPQPIDQMTDEALGLLRRAEFIELHGAHAARFLR